MRNVRFDTSGSSPVFKYDNELGEVEFVDYKPPIDLLDPNINVADYCVELLINPLLSNESNVYMLLDPNNATNQKVGVVMPISVLSSDEQPEHKIHNYIFAAFYVLLERIDDIKETEFYKNFEPNICVFVVDRRRVHVEHPLSHCIHTLRKYGYSYFENDNSIKPPVGYVATEYIRAGQKNIRLEFKEPELYSDPMVDTLMRALPSAHDATHRFVLLYQVIELLMEKAAITEINNYITSLSIQDIPSNDFVHGVNELSTEKEKIKEIFTKANITSAESSEFRDACLILYGLIHYNNPKVTSSNDALLYSFRNQMTHSFRMLRKEQAALATTIQRFEILILRIIERYVP